MKNYEIVVDSSCDLNESLRRKYGIYPECIRSVVYLPNGEQRLADPELKSADLKQFYFD